MEVSRSVYAVMATRLLKPRSHLAEYCPIFYDRNNCAIANNLKPIGTIIVSVKNRYLSYNDFELFAYFSETVLMLSK